MHAENFILTADWHLTDSEIESYRWNIFDTLRAISLQHAVTQILVLGDITDRKDRHAGNLLNRLVHALKDLSNDAGVVITILMGNHDAPLNGTPYWTFLNEGPIHYITEPTILSGILLLPFSANPAAEWADLDFNKCAVMMHQTLAGSLVDGDRKIEYAPHPLPLFPRGVPIYSGDVHRPQSIGGVTYVGAPHPVRFSETWENRVLVIKKNDFKNPHQVNIRSIRRAILDISSSDQLKSLRFGTNDQLKIRYMLTAGKMAEWPKEEQAIRDWAAKKGIVLASVEATLQEELTLDSKPKASAMELMRPDEVIRQFGESEKLSEDVIAVGQSLLDSALKR